jgi:hypothetical protein
MTTASLTPNAAADLCCDLIDDFLFDGRFVPRHVVLCLTDAKTDIEQTQHLISAGYLQDIGIDVLNREVTYAMDLLREVRAEYERGTA